MGIVTGYDKENRFEEERRLGIYRLYWDRGVDYR